MHIVVIIGVQIHFKMITLIWKYLPLSTSWATPTGKNLLLRMQILSLKSSLGKQLTGVKSPVAHKFWSGPAFFFFFEKTFIPLMFNTKIWHSGPFSQALSIYPSSP